jgi:hypothetical protein
MWLEEVLFQMADVRDQDLIEPDVELDPSEEVVGEVSRELRQMYTLMMHARAKIESPEQLHLSRLGLAMSGRGRALYVTNLKAETLRNIFFLSLYEQVCPENRWPLDELQVRKGWKIVRVPIHC